MLHASRSMKKNRKKQKQDCLVGRFFHSIEGGKVDWQGVVIGRISEDRYLVQLLEWPMGEPSVQRIVSVSEMSPWLFYNDADEMGHSYEHGPASGMKKETSEQIRDY
jgi:hypothetical protein